MIPNRYVDKLNQLLVAHPESEVIIAVSTEKYMESFLLDTFPTLLKEHPSEKHELGVFWYLSGIKWYEGYEDIDQVMKFFDNFEHDEDYCFVRLGEEFGNVSERGKPYLFEIYPQQFFETPVIFK